MESTMMHPEYRTFLRLLRLLAYYAPENYYHLSSSIYSDDPDETWAREHIEDLHLISLEDYLEFIYTPRRLEANLKREFQFNPDLIYLIGPLGSGKTSLALRLRRDLHASVIHNYYVAYIDVRQALSGRNQAELAGNDLREFLRGLVMDCYMSDLFQYERHNGDHKNPAIELWAFLLDTDRLPSQARELTKGLSELRTQAALLYDGYVSPKLGQDKIPTYYDWLEHQGPTNAEVRELLRALTGKIDLKHIVAAARHAKSIVHQIIWFDNVDALEYSQQDAIHDHLRSFQTNVAGLASIVIALRDENIRHFDLRETKHEHGAPPYGRRFVIEMPMEDHHFSYPGHILPPPAAETLREAIRKRLEATKRLQSKKLKALYIWKSEKEYEAEKRPAERERISREINEIQEEIKSFAPAISNELFNHLSELSARATEVLIFEKGAQLANNSLREVFRMHRDFLVDLLLRGTDGQSKPVALAYKNWFMATLFLIWIRRTDRPFKLTLEDIFEHFHRWKEPGTRVIGCSLPYIVINSLWNIELEKSRLAGRRTFPTLGELLERINLLGYSDEDVIQQINLLIERSILRLRFPEESFRNGSETQMYATYCGKCLTGSTYNSFGYLYECLEQAQSRERSGATSNATIHPLAASARENTLMKGETGARHQVLETEQAISELLPYLRNIARMHATELERIRGTGRLGAVGWLDKYRELFGIPNEGQFKRSEVADQTPGRRKELQLEAMIRGLLSYVKKFPIEKKKLGELLATYSVILKKLNKFNDVEIPD